MNTTNSSDMLEPAKAVKARFGNVSDMTIWRWVKSGTLPPPIKINGRKYWRSSTISAKIDELSASQAAA